MTEILIGIITALIGGFIGTFLGSYLISKRQERKMSKTRKIAIKALDIIKGYIEKGQPITNAENEFNRQFSIPEKRAIIVALHKLGISIGVAVNETFNISKICFVKKNIDVKTIDDIKTQINNGYCDNLFYVDPDTIFSTNSLFTLRNVAKKYVTEVLSKSTLNIKENKIDFESGWEKNFTLGELKSLLVFNEQVNVPINFDGNGKPLQNRIESLQKDIDLGLFDTYLTWNYEIYFNVKYQNQVINEIKNPPIKF